MATDEKTLNRYRFGGKVELSCVTFFVDAASKDEAIALAKVGDYAEIETDAAEIHEVEIYTESCDLAADEG